MKKFITLLLVLTGMVSTAMATNNKNIYFKPDAGAWAAKCSGFALYMWKNGQDVNSWQSFSQIGTTGIYKTTIDIDLYDRMIICGMKSSGATGWSYVYNESSTDFKSGDLTAPSTSFYYDKTNCDYWGGGWTGGTSGVSTRTIDDSPVVAGWHHITKNDEEWNSSSTNNQMTMDLTTTGNNTLTVSDRYLKAGTYQYKYFINSSWTPASNQTLNILSDGKYTIEYTYNQFTGAHSVSASKTADATVSYTYYVKDNGESITGNEWESNEMSNDGTNAVYNVNEKTLSSGTYKYWIIERTFVDGVKNRDYQYLNSGDPAGDASYAWIVTTATNDDYDVEFKYNLASENISADASLGYYLFKEGVSWATGERMTKTNGIYYATITNWGGKHFDIVPAEYKAEANGGTWTHVIRPYNSGSNCDIEFHYYENTAVVNQGSASWYVYPGLNVDLTFNPSNYFWTVDAFISRTLHPDAEGYATFSYTADVIPDPNLTSVQYVSAVNTSTGEITWEDFAATGIKAGEGALLKGTAGKTYKFKHSDSAVATGGNLLKAINAATAASALPQHDGGNTNYILSKVGGHVGFYKVNASGSWVNEGTAYLQVSGTLARDFFDLEGESTSIEAVKKEQKMSGECYNLAGQRVAQPTKGLYIVNGKKYIVK